MFLAIYRWILVRMRNVSDKLCREKQNTHFMFNDFFFSRKSCYLWDFWKSVVEPDRRQMPIWRMHIEYWTPKFTNTHSEYVILTAFPLQQWLYERALMLPYTYVHCLPSIEYRALRFSESSNDVNRSFSNLLSCNFHFGGSKFSGSPKRVGLLL